MSCHQEHAMLVREENAKDLQSPRALDPKEQRARRKLQIALGCATTFMSVEIVGGLLAGSLAILTDAAHLLSDVVGFAISLFAIYAMAWPTSARMSFGFKRAEVIGALLSILVIWILTAILVYEAIQRFQQFLKPNAQQVVDGKIMFFVASVGLVMNIFLMVVLGGTEGSDQLQQLQHQQQLSMVSPHRDIAKEQSRRGQVMVELAYGTNGKTSHANSKNHESKKNPKATKPKVKQLENLNVQAAYIHALGDLVQSIGVCIAGGLIWYNPEWQLADPIATFLFGILVLMTTSGVIKRSVHVLMEGTPEGIDWDEIEQGINALPAVQACHDLHIWSLSAGLPSLSVHITSYSPNEALAQAEEYLHLKGIDHTTIQVEDLSSYHVAMASLEHEQRNSLSHSGKGMKSQEELHVERGSMAA